MVNQPLIFERGKPGRSGTTLPPCDVPEVPLTSLIPEEMLRQQPLRLPEVSEVEIVRHYTALSRRNYGVDNGFYPLGSCTMKYNPKVNEDMAALPGLTDLHPLQPENMCQGTLALLYAMQQYLAEITGMDAVTTQPVAGAHGELVGLKIIRAYHEKEAREMGLARSERTKIIVPDSSHGTNPASAAMAGFTTVTVKSNSRGGVDLEALKKVVGGDTAGIMLTNPNTLGLFEEDIEAIAAIVHDAGGLLYYDGANANALLGHARPGDMGFDVVHLNLHKTFSTPHGGGGPGAGPMGVKAFLEPFLPKPVLVKRTGADGRQGKPFRYEWDHRRPDSIGRMHGFYGNFAIVLRAYAYILALGPAGLKQVSEDAVLNANYLMNRLKKQFDLPYDRICKHEFVLSGRRQKAKGVSTLDMAKRLLDYGYHPPTIYFPLIVEEAIMIEPTETETKETLDRFAETLIQIAREAEESPELLHEAPHVTPVRRLDEVTAARKPVLRWKPV